MTDNTTDEISLKQLIENEATEIKGAVTDFANTLVAFNTTLQSIVQSGNLSMLNDSVVLLVENLNELAEAIGKTKIDKNSIATLIEEGNAESTALDQLTESIKKLGENGDLDNTKALFKSINDLYEGYKKFSDSLPKSGKAEKAASAMQSVESTSEEAASSRIGFAGNFVSGALAVYLMGASVDALDSIFHFLPENKDLHKKMGFFETEGDAILNRGANTEQINAANYGREIMQQYVKSYNGMPIDASGTGFFREMQYIDAKIKTEAEKRYQAYKMGIPTALMAENFSFLDLYVKKDSYGNYAPHENSDLWSSLHNNGYGMTYLIKDGKKATKNDNSTNTNTPHHHAAINSYENSEIDHTLRQRQTSAPGHPTKVNNTHIDHVTMNFNLPTNSIRESLPDIKKMMIATLQEAVNQTDIK